MTKLLQSDGMPASRASSVRFSATADCENGRVTASERTCVDGARTADELRACQGLPPVVKAPPRPMPPARPTGANEVVYFATSVKGAREKAPVRAELEAHWVEWMRPCLWKVKPGSAWTVTFVVAPDGKAHLTKVESDANPGKDAGDATVSTCFSTVLSGHDPFPGTATGDTEVGIIWSVN